MLLRPRLTAFAVMAAAGLFIGRTSAATITLTCVGTSYGQSVQATNTFNLSVGLLSNKNKNNNSLTSSPGGIIFSSSGACSDGAGPLIHIYTNPSGPSGIPSLPDDSHDNCPPCPSDVENPFNEKPDQENAPHPCTWHEGNIDRTCNNSVPGQINPSVSSPTPLPASIWGAGALIGGIGLFRRVAKRRGK